MTFPPPPGLPLHHELRGPCDLRGVVGYVGEQLVARAIDAAPWRADDIDVQIDGEARAVRPDLWWETRNAVVEVKSAIRGRRYYVTQEQLDSYAQIHMTSTWPADHPAVYYAFVHFPHPYAHITETRIHAGVTGRKLKKPFTVAEVMSALLPTASSPLVVAYPVVAAWARLWGTTGRSWSGPLSPLLGDYAAYYRFTTRKVEAAAATPHFCAGRVGAVAAYTDTGAARVISYPTPKRRGRLHTVQLSLF